MNKSLIVPVYLTAREALGHLGLTEIDTVYRYIREGKLKAYRLGEGGPWRIKPEDIQAFITGQEPEPQHTESSD